MSPANETVDYLDEDIVTVPGQLYVLLSFVTPDGPQKNERCGMKVRGVFATREEAEAHVRKIMRFDNQFHIYIAEMYKWLPIPPDPNGIEDQEYSEKFLNDLMKGYKQSQLAAKQHFEHLKREKMEKGLEATLTSEERLPPPPDVFNAPDPHPSTSGTSVSAP